MDFLTFFISTLIVVNDVLCGIRLKHNDTIHMPRKSDMNEYKRRRSTKDEEIQKRQAAGKKEDSVTTGECHVEF